MAEEKPINQPEATEVVTATAKNGRKRFTVLLDPDEVVEHHVHGFANFLREYGVIGLAVGFVAGFNVNAVVKQLVDSFITPVVTLLFGKTLASRTFTLSWHGRSVAFAWGEFVYTLVNFMFILIAIYAIIKIFKLDRFKKIEAKKKK